MLIRFARTLVDNRRVQFTFFLTFLLMIVISEYPAAVFVLMVYGLLMFIASPTHNYFN